MTALPTGRQGQMAALGVTAVAVALAWFAAASPVLGWYADRTDYLAEQQTLAARMQAVAGTAPALQETLARANAAGPPTRVLFEGATDAMAGAALQQSVQDIAAHAGATVLSAEMLPASSVGDDRRIGIHVTVSGSWPILMAVLGAAQQATPRMMVEQLELRQTQSYGIRDALPMQAGLTLVAFAGRPQAMR